MEPGMGDGENEPMENSEKENLHLQFSDDIPFPSTLRKENWKRNLR